MTRERVVGRVADHLAARAEALPHTLRVAVDGITAAGKTTFADDVATALSARGVPALRVTMDGFHHPRAHRHRQGRDSAAGYYEDAYDFDAVRRVLLDPLGPGGDGRYRDAVLDLASDTPLAGDLRSAPPGAVLVVDGSFLQRELSWDDVVFLAVEPAVARARGVRRDEHALGGAEATDELYRKRYHAACERYLAEVGPADRASVLVDVDDPATPRLLRIDGPAGSTAPLFSYGTLQQPEVQRATFGHLLAGRPAEVVGHRLEWLRITDPEVVATSGTDRHPVVRAGAEDDVVPGSVLTVTAEELAAADLYEVDDYRRRRVALADGGHAWMYLGA